eukprot:TRINITY_DN10837_c0_g1_i2.p1 TRINITY_DN10837_c0_g1~~TRINITY_DN10837_c0_g1_i2.p1  ORF type:complete len:330 (+),score=44.21 TRINITY_DN10837_c0_g1_i2:38-1027(+)
MSLKDSEAFEAVVVCIKAELQDEWDRGHLSPDRYRDICEQCTDDFIRKYGRDCCEKGRLTSGATKDLRDMVSRALRKGTKRRKSRSPSERRKRKRSRSASRSRSRGRSRSRSRKRRSKRSKTPKRKSRSRSRKKSPVRSRKAKKASPPVEEEATDEVEVVPAEPVKPSKPSASATAPQKAAEVIDVDVRVSRARKAPPPPRVIVAEDEDEEPSEAEEATPPAPVVVPTPTPPAPTPAARPVQSQSSPIVSLTRPEFRVSRGPSPPRLSFGFQEEVPTPCADALATTPARGTTNAVPERFARITCPAKQANFFRLTLLPQMCERFSASAS